MGVAAPVPLRDSVAREAGRAVGARPRRVFALGSVAAVARSSALVEVRGLVAAGLGHRRGLAATLGSSGGACMWQMQDRRLCGVVGHDRTAKLHQNLSSPSQVLVCIQTGCPPLQAVTNVAGQHFDRRALLLTRRVRCVALPVELAVALASKVAGTFEARPGDVLALGCALAIPS